jgi:hypothetical protein
MFFSSKRRKFISKFLSTLVPTPAFSLKDNIASKSVAYEENKGYFTINQLKDYDYTANGVSFVMGYHAPGDGGGGFFLWDADNVLPENGGTVFKSNHSTKGRWVRIFDGSINVKWFGVRADSVHDDTASFKKLTEYINTLEKVKLQLDGGVIVLSNEITFAHAGSKLNELIIDGNCAEFRLLNTSFFIGSKEKNIKLYISKLFINCKDDSFYSKPALFIENIFQSTFDSVSITCNKTRPAAILIRHLWATIFTNCQFGYASVGGIFGESGKDVTHTNYVGCTFDHCQDLGAIMLHHIACTIQSCSFENNDGAGLLLTSGISTSSNVKIENNYFLSNCQGKNYTNKYAALSIGSKIHTLPFSAVQQSHISVQGNYITGTHQRYAIHANIFCGFVCLNNRLEGVEADILLEGTAAFVSPILGNRNHSNGKIRIIGQYSSQ